jgi:hypothetical protein
MTGRIQITFLSAIVELAAPIPTEALIAARAISR